MDDYMDTHCTYTEGRGTYTFTGPCKKTGKFISVTVRAQELYALRRGVRIQEALKSNTPGEREFLKSGYSPEGWNLLFGKKA